MCATRLQPPPFFACNPLFSCNRLFACNPLFSCKCLYSCLFACNLLNSCAQGQTVPKALSHSDTHTQAHTDTHTQAHAHTHTHTHTHTHRFTDIHTHTHTHAHKHTHKHTDTQTHMHIDTQTHRQCEECRSRRNVARCLHGIGACVPVTTPTHEHMERGQVTEMCRVTWPRPQHTCGDRAGGRHVPCTHKRHVPCHLPCLLVYTPTHMWPTPQDRGREVVEGVQRAVY